MSVSVPGIPGWIERPVVEHATPGQLAQYKTDYTRGWKYAARPTATYDHLDAKGASHAEYDGYDDYATGREKWHLLHCPNHDHCSEM